jgi:hypothetical protein
VLGDENVAESNNGSLEADHAQWLQQLIADIQEAASTATLHVYEEEPAPGQDDALSSDDEEDSKELQGSPSQGNDGVLDLEDLGSAMTKGQVRCGCPFCLRATSPSWQRFPAFLPEIFPPSGHLCRPSARVRKPMRVVETRGPW